MKLTLELGDKGSLEAFSRVCSGITRVSKGELPIRVSPEGVFFLISDVCGDCGTWMSYCYPAPEFSRFVIDGYSEEQNEIVFTVKKEEFGRALSNTTDERCVIKLTKRDNSPHLSINLFGIRSTVNHLIPVSIVLPEFTRVYKRPDLNIDVMLAVTLPSVRVISKILTALKNLQIKNVTFKISTSGELEILGVSDKVDIKMFFESMRVTGSQCGVFFDNQEVISSSVRLPVRCLYAIWGSFFHGTQPNVIMRIEPDRYAIVTAEIDQNRLELIVPGLVDNSEQ